MRNNRLRVPKPGVLLARGSLRTLICWVALTTTVWSADPLWSVARLNESKGDWPVLTNTTLRVEGRVGAHLKGQFRYQNCSLTFLLTPELERRMLPKRNVEVTGHLRLQDNQPVFEVTDLQSRPTDIEQFRAREAALRNPQPADWYSLGAWAQERGTFYRDEELQAAALSCFARGVGMEQARLHITDHAGRFKLAKQADGFHLPAAIVDELRHDGYLSWWHQASSLKEPQPAELAKLVEQLQRDWPDALQPGSPFPTELAQSYGDNPTAAYHAANEAQRQTLRRIFAADVQLRQLELQAARDGRNGRAIAEQIEQLIPERKPLAAQFRDAELMYRLGQVGTASKSDAVELATEFRSRGRAKEANETLLRWIVAKEQRLRPQTAPEFIELADEYLTLLSDESRAVALLIEAHRREPQSQDALQRFEQLGYVYNGIAWTKPRVMPLPTLNPNPTAAPLQLAAGMSSQELVQLLGEPTRRSRVTTGAGGEEFWVYGQANEGSRLVIEFTAADTQAAMRVKRFYHR